MPLLALHSHPARDRLGLPFFARSPLNCQPSQRRMASSTPRASFCPAHSLAVRHGLEASDSLAGANGDGMRAPQVQGSTCRGDASSSPRDRSRQRFGLQIHCPGDDRPQSAVCPEAAVDFVDMVERKRGWRICRIEFIDAVASHVQ